MGSIGLKKLSLVVGSLYTGMLFPSCQDYSTSAPLPTTVQPDRGTYGLDTRVTIQGKNFFPSIRISFQDRSQSEIRTDFQARLGEVGLIDVAYVDVNTLEATVPGTVGPGVHTLTVVDPDRRAGELRDAFTVVECLADMACDDGNICTDDSCVGDGCLHENNQVPCDDGQFCTAIDLCGGGVCAGSGDRCPGQRCDETSDACAECLEDGDCDDGNLCTDDRCVAGSCDRANNALPCDDGQFCTDLDVCTGGGCVGTGSPCGGGYCDEVGDSCSCPVTTTADSGLGSLRACIVAANAAPGSVIAFRIPLPANQSSGSDAWWRISLASGLPAITAAMAIDGSSQTLNQGDTNTRGPEIEIDGSALPAGADGLIVDGASGVKVSHLVLNGFSRHGLEISSSDFVTIYGNYIGTDATGELDRGNGQCGLHLSAGSSEVEAGTGVAGQGNLISGNNGIGIMIEAGVSSVRIIGNFIGTDRTGTTSLGNGGDGIQTSGDDFSIGGSQPLQGNVISGNAGDGLHISGGTILQVHGNIIGSGVTGTESIQNGECGIYLATPGVTIGGTDAGQGNLIARNWTRGIHVPAAGAGSRILGNVIHHSGYSGILSEADGLTIARNITYNNSTRAVWDEVALSSNNQAYNNLFYGAPGDGVSVEGPGVVLNNNIIVANAGYGIRIAGGSLSESHNLITNASTNPANGSGQANTSLDPSDFSADPLFLDEGGRDFRLTECTSPAINAGVNLGALQPDMNGTAPGLFNGSAPDRGALETDCP